MNSKVIKIVSVAAAAVGLGLNLLNTWVDEQKMDEKIDCKIKEALDKEEES